MSQLIISCLMRIHTVCHSVFDFRLKPLFASVHKSRGLTNSSFNHLPSSPQHLENSLELQYYLYIRYIFLGKWNKKSLAQPRFGGVPGSWAMDLSGPANPRMEESISETQGWKCECSCVEYSKTENIFGTDCISFVRVATPESISSSLMFKFAFIFLQGCLCRLFLGSECSWG